MQLPGKAFRIVRFNVRQETKFVKSEKSSLIRRPSAWTSLRWTFRLSDATREGFCDILREIDLAVWKVLYDERRAPLD